MNRLTWALFVATGAACAPVVTVSEPPAPAPLPPAAPPPASSPMADGSWSEPDLDEAVAKAPGTRAAALGQLLDQLGFDASAKIGETLCGGEPFRVTGPVSAAHKHCFNLDADGAKECVVDIDVEARTEPADGAPGRLIPLKYVLVFGRDSERMVPIGRTRYGSDDDERITLDFVSVHATFVDIRVALDMNACLADPRHLRMRETNILTVARGTLEGILALRQGPWEEGQPSPPPIAFTDSPPRTAVCDECMAPIMQVRHRFDAAAYHYVPAE